MCLSLSIIKCFKLLFAGERLEFLLFLYRGVHCKSKDIFYLFWSYKQRRCRKCKIFFLAHFIPIKSVYLYTVDNKVISFFWFWVEFYSSYYCFWCCNIGKIVSWKAYIRWCCRTMSEKKKELEQLEKANALKGFKMVC